MIMTQRVTLRPARMTDPVDVPAMLSHPAAMRYWATPEHETLDLSQAWLEGMVAAGPDSDDYLIEYQGQVIGKAGA
jgi:ribosomal-protein-alanine N-acetyltransferase